MLVRRLSHLLLVFFLTLAIPQYIHAAPANVKLSGKIINPTADSIEVSYNDNNLAYYPKKFSTHLDKKGCFKLSFPVPANVYTIVQIAYADRLADIIVSTGDSLVMTVNAKRFDSTVNYAGRGANIQNFLAAHVIKRGRINQYPNNVKNQLQKEPKDFLKAIDNENNLEQAMAEKWTPALPAAFTGYWRTFHLYYNYFFIQQYPLARQMVKLRRYTDTIPPENYEVVKSMPVVFNDSFLQVPSYLLYLTGVLEIGLKADGYTVLGKDTTKYLQFEDSVYKLAYKVLPNKSLEYFIAQNIYGRAKTQRLARTEAQLSTFKQRWPASTYMPLLDKQVGLARRLAPGQPAPDMEIHTADGKIMKLSDLKGKVVYLGFWAGWCRQCVGEMINERMVKDLIRKKPLEFVYASIGTDTAGERGVIERYRIDGLYTNLFSGWNAREVQAYGVQSLPAYYLIDEDGNFALQRAPSPMQTTELVMEIEKLFK